MPEDLAGDTGAITVYKYACPVTVPPAGFDWYGRCDPQGQGVQFSLSVWDGSRFLPVVTAATDGDGILRFTRLQPGRYDLQEVDATWCHAESDSVNAQGQVVVAAGKRASVWIFNCVGAKNPPNTGAGPGAMSGGPWPGAAVGPGSAAGRRARPEPAVAAGRASAPAPLRSGRIGRSAGAIHRDWRAPFAPVLVMTCVYVALFAVGAVAMFPRDLHSHPRVPRRSGCRSL